MDLFRRKQPQPEPQPKGDYTPLVQELLDEANKLQREILRRIRAGERRSSKSVLILNDRQAQILRTLIHEIGVLPVVDDATGMWKLFR
jgi:hypothetical protein